MIKKFKAQTMQEAMKLAKAQFGQDAVILQSRKIRHSGLFDKPGAEMVEITATSDQSLTKKAPATKLRERTYSPTTVKKVSNLTADKSSAEIKTELLQLKDAVLDMSNYVRHDKMLLLPNTHKLLIEKGVEERLASELVQKTFLALDGPDLKDDSRIMRVLKKRGHRNP